MGRAVGDPMFDVEATGGRIDHLLDRIGQDCGQGAAVLAEDLVRELLALYGAGLGRVLEVVHREAAGADDVIGALAADPLVAGLLALHDLHPVAVHDRVAAALTQLRARTGAAIELVGLADDTATIRVDVSGCASTRATLRDALESAVQRAAPEIAQVVIDSDRGPSGRGPSGSPGALIPAESLLRGPPRGGATPYPAAPSSGAHLATRS